MVIDELDGVNEIVRIDVLNVNVVPARVEDVEFGEIELLCHNSGVQ